jgi:hypothetical protein
VKAFAVALAVSAFLFSASETLAAGYGPYSPHIPEDTFGSTSILTIAAVLSYAAGVGLITYSKILRGKFLAQREG